MADEPDIIQKLSVDFNVVNDISIDFTSSPQPVKVQMSSSGPISAEFSNDTKVDANFISNIQPIDVQFGTVYVVGGDCHVLYSTTDTWNR